MARPKDKTNRSLPPYLRFDSSRGMYRLTLVNGVRKSISKERNVAIQIANEYNRIMRPGNGDLVQHLVMQSGGGNEEHQPFGKVVDELVSIIFDEEQPSHGCRLTMLNDAKRAKEFFLKIPCSEISLEHVNGYLLRYHKGASASVQNSKLYFLEKLFKYAMDRSLMRDNPAKRKMRKRKEGKKRRRLGLDAYKEIHQAAPLWLQTAMDLALQTTHARLEISRLKYKLKEPSEGQCGCCWFDEPVNGIYGTIFIHRQKTKEKEASHVAIPIGEVLKGIIDRSRDGIVCPYIVHRRPYKMGKQSLEVAHRYQVVPNYISRAFSKVRDELHLFDHLDLQQRPTFHEIRALSAKQFCDMGIDPQSRMAHASASSTKIYTQNHCQWTEVPHGEIMIAN